jgi:CubicO group peptidase (beta-lactamase class C family)
MITVCYDGDALLPGQAAATTGETMTEPRKSDWTEVNQDLELRWAESRVPGMTAAIVHGAEVVYSKALGVASHTTGLPVTPRSLFCVASLSKPFVAVAVLQLVERGLVDLDAPVRDHVPYFHIRGAEGISVRHLLQHTSGLSHGRVFRGDERGDDGALERAVRRLASRRVRSAPGTRYSYSNLGFMVAGDLVARASGQFFEDYVADHILRPLGMNDSTYVPGEAPANLLTVGHMRTALVVGKPRALKREKLRRAYAPVGGLYTNVLDLGRWASAHLHQGRFQEARVLAPETFSLLTSDPIRLPGGSSVGLGWFLRTMNEPPAFGYVGTTLGYKAHILIDPSRSTAAILLCNSLLEPTKELFGVVTAAASRGS